MECSFCHNLLFSAFLKQSSARGATTNIAAGPVQQNLQLHARWEDSPVLFSPALSVTFFSLLKSRELEVEHREEQSWEKRVQPSCQPSRSRRDSPDLETETRRPARRPKKADSSRFVPINAQKHDFKLAFCLFSLFFSRKSSFFCVFLPFLVYPSVAGSYPNKKSSYIRALFW